MYQIAKFLFCSVLLNSIVSHAGLFRFESETLLTDRKDAYLRHQLPILESIQSSYETDTNDTALHTNFSFYGDPVQKEYDFELHSLNGSFKPTSSLQIQVGRSFNTYFLVRAATTDSVVVSWKPYWQSLTVSAYGGLQQQTELKNVDIQTDLSGLSFQYQSLNLYPLKIQMATEHLNYRSTLTYENIGKLSLSKQFQASYEPEFIIINEADMNSGHQNRFDVGMNLYPSIYSNWNVHYLQYELNPSSGWEDPISTIFSQGRIDEVSFGMSLTLSPQWIVSFEAGVDRYLLQQELMLMTTGERGTLDLSYKAHDWNFSNQIMAIQSYGGTVWADIFQLQYPLIGKSNLQLNNEYVSYQKITSSKRDALSTQIGIGTWVWNHSKLNMLAEYNRNNFVQDEFKVIGQLLIMEWIEL